jgi:hypothetical protein
MERAKERKIPEIIDTGVLEERLKGNPLSGMGQEATARTILWLRLANLAALAHELIVAELKKSKEEK